MKVVGYVVEEEDGSLSVYEPGLCVNQSSDPTQRIGDLVIYKGQISPMCVDGDGDPSVNTGNGRIWLYDTRAQAGARFSRCAEDAFFAVRKESLEELEARMAKAWQ